MKNVTIRTNSPESAWAARAALASKGWVVGVVTKKGFIFKHYECNASFDERSNVKTSTTRPVDEV